MFDLMFCFWSVYLCNWEEVVMPLEKTVKQNECCAMLLCSHQTQTIIYHVENARRTVEVSVPMAVAMDSSKDDSVPHASMTSIRR